MLQCNAYCVLQGSQRPPLLQAEGVLGLMVEGDLVPEFPAARVLYRKAGVGFTGFSWRLQGYLGRRLHNAPLHDTRVFPAGRDQMAVLVQEAHVGDMTAVPAVRVAGGPEL